MSSGVSFIVDFGIKQRSKEIPSRDMRHSEIQYYCSVTLIHLSRSMAYVACSGSTRRSGGHRRLISARSILDLNAEQLSLLFLSFLHHRPSSLSKAGSPSLYGNGA